MAFVAVDIEPVLPEPTTSYPYKKIIEDVFTPQLQERMSQIFPANGRVGVNHLRSFSTFQDGHLFFLNLAAQGRIPFEVVDRLFDSQTGLWKLQAPEGLHVYNMSPDEAGDALLRVFGIIYQAVSPSLDTTLDYGFNKHDEQHIENDRAFTNSLLMEARTQRGDITEAVLRRGQIVAVLHDIGNLLDRDDHPAASILLALKVMQQLYFDNPYEFFTIAAGILLHHDVQINDFMRLRGLTADDAVSALSVLPPEAHAHIIADTADIGRHRISPLAGGSEAFIDTHFEVNAFWQTKFIGLSSDGRSLNLRLVFNNTITPGEEEEMGKFAKPTTHSEEGRRIQPHSSTIDEYRYNGKPHFQTLAEKATQIYGEQFVLAAISAFDLYPQIDKFVVEYSDPNLRSHFEGQEAYATYTDDDWEKASHRKIVIKRDHIEEAKRRFEEGDLQLIAA